MATIDRYPTVTLIPSDEDSQHRDAGRAGRLTTFGRSITAKGQLSATDHVIIEGTVEGDVVVPDHGVAVTGIARVRGNVFARTVTVLGRIDGNLTASRLIELRASCVVSGRLSSPSLIIEDGARFSGPVEPGKADVAVALARHRAKNP
ncbi:MAG: polymer-forming cytoskeletal protein [Acidobacteria bacterium]|nr:polymer-forming cytoskeletal protein [Acidobacteriota bacterium]